MANRILKHRGGETGQALVELALTMPVLILLLVGAVEFARIAYAAIEVSNAAKAAVQYGASSAAAVTDPTGMLLAAQSDAEDLNSSGTSLISFPSAPVVTGICSDGSACTGAGNTCTNTDCSTTHIENILTVETQATISTPFNLPGLLPATVRLNGRAQQKVTNQ